MLEQAVYRTQNIQVLGKNILTVRESWHRTVWKPMLTQAWDLQGTSPEQLGCAGLFSTGGVITWCWLCSP